MAAVPWVGAAEGGRVNGAGAASRPGVDLGRAAIGVHAKARNGGRAMGGIRACPGKGTRLVLVVVLVLGPYDLAAEATAAAGERSSLAPSPIPLRAASVVCSPLSVLDSPVKPKEWLAPLFT